MLPGSLVQKNGKALLKRVSYRGLVAKYGTALDLKSEGGRIESGDGELGCGCDDVDRAMGKPQIPTLLEIEDIGVDDLSARFNDHVRQRDGAPGERRGVGSLEGLELFELGKLEPGNPANFGGVAS